MTCSQTDNEISVELVGTSRPCDSIETEKIPISYISMKIETTQTLPPLETMKKTNTLDAPLAETDSGSYDRQRYKHRI